MRIAYGIHGYGRGHAGRSLAVLAELTRRHEVLVLAGGDAVALLQELEVARIPVLAFGYRGPRLSALETLRRNAPLLASLAFGGGPVAEVEARLRQFRPEVVVSDSEPLVLHAARRLGIPRIGFDHVGIIAWCRPEAPLSDALQLRRDGALYRLLLGRPERVIVSSFFAAPPRWPGVRLVPPVLRERVLRASPRDGEHLLVYFNQPRRVTPGMLAELDRVGVPVVVYGAGGPRREGLREHKAIDEQGFVEDLATARAVLSTAGHQLASEALYLGKPLLLCPEDCAEQRLNARELVRLGVARALEARRLSGDLVRRFLDGNEVQRAAWPRHLRSGNGPALEVLEAELRAAAGASRASPLTGRQVAGALR